MQVGRGGRGRVRGGVGALARLGFFVGGVVAGLSALVALPARAQISVSSGGSPSYAVNIAVPAGIAGMAPNLSLAYTGGGVNGPQGFGWTLSGVSLITRCAGNALSDGQPMAVSYTPQDRLCLDGQRLIQTDANGNPTASTPAANGALLDANGRAEDGSYTEYRVDKDIYARIRAYGMANGASANGPRYFKVWTKAGQIYEYGATSSVTAATTNSLISPYNQSIAIAWAVARISDTVGNFIDFKYGYRNIAWGSGTVAGTPTMGHEWNLAEIQYTGNSTTGQVANNKIVFEYEDRPDTPGTAQDRSEAYHAGNKSVSVQRLKAVRTYVNWPSGTMGVTMPSGALVAVPSTAVKVKVLKIGYEVGPQVGRSRIISTTECVGSAETTCFPSTTFKYAATSTNEVFAPSATFSASSLSTLQLEKADGTMGVLLGDFDGDGKTDIIRWSDTPSQNQLYTSAGAGAFNQVTAFSLTNVNLFRSDGCYASYAMDFNGDGLTDILRVMQPTSASGSSCGTVVNYLFLSKGDGTFTTVTLPSNISFTQTNSVQTRNCTSNVVNVAMAKASLAAPDAIIGCSNPPKFLYSSTVGFNYYIIDVNGDGLPDIITTTAPAYSNQSSLPLSLDAFCQGPCTHVYLGSVTGVFTELTTTNLASHSLYGAPKPAPYSPFSVRPYVADQNGDGLADLLVNSGTWLSLGNGNFTQTSSSGAVACSYPLDFNGDNRADCLNLFSPTSTGSLSLGDGTGTYPTVAGFNLTAASVLTGTGLGISLADLDGDGRTDIIRWNDDPTQNIAYMSNGDGTFRASSLFNLNTTGTPLKKSDGTIDFVTGDFTGNGNVEILRTVSSITPGQAATTNQLFVKSSAVPPDQLSSVTSSTGLTSRLTYVPLANSSSGSLGLRYQSARMFGPPAPYPQIDLILPMWVVATVQTDSGVGTSTTVDEYAYIGLRANMNGLGLLGFQTVKEQHSAPDGSPLTTETTYLQAGGYVGVAGVTQTLDAPLNSYGPVISRTTNSYCDQTSNASPTAITTAGTPPTPCVSTALVQRPYLYQSLEEGWDIDANRTALPTVTTTNAFNTTGDPTQISVVTQGTSAGVAQTVTKVTNNVFQANNTAGDAWILGRLQSSTQTNTVPSILGSIATQAGSSPTATATQGTGPTTPPPPTSTPPSINAILPVILQILLSD